tara:strand:+ start:256 stop:462 length:207 start_codon:yes stop_codon:yes gene_type:complete
MGVKPPAQLKSIGGLIKMKIIQLWNRIFNPTYLSWQKYKNKIDFLEVLNWQQDVRKRNLKNSDQIGNV